MRAWRHLSTYAGRSTIRAWLYKIATNACLDALASHPKRSLPQHLYPPADPQNPVPKPIHEPIWLEPFPDEFLAPQESSPESRYDARESISLSFLAALQALPPRQRCVLVLRDVLDWHAAELAEMLGASLSTVNSLLHRARIALKKAYPESPDNYPSRPLADPATKAVLDRYVHAWESADVEEIISLLTDETAFAMPPLPLWLRGRAAIRELIVHMLLDGDSRGRWHLLPLHANCGPAFAWYQKGVKGNYQAYSIQLLRFRKNKLCEIVTWLDPTIFHIFNLPAELQLPSSSNVNRSK